MTSEQDTAQVYQVELTPAGLWGSPSGTLFADEETAKEFIEEFAYQKHGLRAGEWNEQMGKWVMLFENGDGDQGAWVTEKTVYDTVPEVDDGA